MLYIASLLIIKCQGQRPRLVNVMNLPVKNVNKAFNCHVLYIVKSVNEQWCLLRGLFP